MTRKGAEVVGISTDSVETLRKFKAENQLPFTLLSDAKGEVAEKYGGTVPVLGLANRVTYVIGKDGAIVQITTGGDAIDPTTAIAACPGK